MSEFESELEQAAELRHRDILSRLAREGRRRLPLPSRPRDDDGFVSAEEAAAVMGLTEDELSELVLRGLLESRYARRRLLVRPAIVSVLGVRQEPSR